MLRWRDTSGSASSGTAPVPNATSSQSGSAWWPPRLRSSASRPQRTPSPSGSGPSPPATTSTTTSHRDPSSVYPGWRRRSPTPSAGFGRSRSTPGPSARRRARRRSEGSSPACPRRPHSRCYFDRRGWRRRSRPALTRWTSGGCCSTPWCTGTTTPTSPSCPRHPCQCPCSTRPP